MIKHCIFAQVGSTYSGVREHDSLRYHSTVAMAARLDTTTVVCYGRIRLTRHTHYMWNFGGVRRSFLHICRRVRNQKKLTPSFSATILLSTILRCVRAISNEWPATDGIFDAAEQGDHVTGQGL